MNKIKSRLKKREYINFSNIRWVVLQTKPFLPQIALIVAVDAAVSGIGVWMSLLIKKLVDAATEIAQSADSGAVLGSAETSGVLSRVPEVISKRPEIAQNISLYIAIIIASLILNAVSSMFSVWVTEKYNFHVRRSFFGKILKTRWLPITSYHSGDIMTRLTSDVSVVTGGVIDVLSSVVSLVVRFSMSFLILMQFDPQLSLFALVLGPAAAAASFYFGRKLKRLQVKVQESESKYRSFMQENISNILIVKSFNAEEPMKEKLSKLFDERLKWVLKRNRMSVIMNSVLGFTYSAGYLVAMAWGVIKISLGLISYGTMTLFLQLVSQIQGPIVQLSRTIPTFISILASAGRINEVNSLEKEEYKREYINSDSIEVNVENAAFSYGNDKIFENLSLAIAEGETVAVTGESGIGKTTLIRLMMDYLTPESGSVGFNSRGEGFKASPGMRRNISYVPQGNTLFSGTIRDNILLGDPDADDGRIREVLRIVSAEAFVDALPDGVDTAIGERGVGLSEGQSQRIAIARALIKKAPLIIFDEATSALDEKTELDIVNNIRTLDHRPTCILITHRREIIPLLDREIIIKDNKSNV